jgi:O-antigen/teichoic acid export membrane protein
MAASFTWFAAAGLLALVAIQCNLDLILQVFLRKPQFLLAREAIFFLLLANLSFGVYYNLSFWYKFSGKTWWGTIISVVGLGLNALLNYLLVPVMGMNGAAIAILCASLCMSAASWFLGRWEFPVAWAYGKVGMLLVFALLFCRISEYLPGNFFWQLGAGILLPLLFLGLIAMVQRKEIRRHAA